MHFSSNSQSFTDVKSKNDIIFKYKGKLLKCDKIFCNDSCDKVFKFIQLRENKEHKLWQNKELIRVTFEKVKKTQTIH